MSSLAIAGVLIGSAANASAGLAEENVTNATLVVASPSAAPEPMAESAYDFAEEHESNGPEGDRGVPMQRLSLFGFGLVLIVLLGSGGLAAVARKPPEAER